MSAAAGLRSPQRQVALAVVLGQAQAGKADAAAELIVGDPLEHGLQGGVQPGGLVCVQLCCEGRLSRGSCAAATAQGRI